MEIGAIVTLDGGKSGFEGIVTGYITLPQIPNRSFIVVRWLETGYSGVYKEKMLNWKRNDFALYVLLRIKGEI